MVQFTIVEKQENKHISYVVLASKVISVFQHLIHSIFTVF